MKYPSGQVAPQVLVTGLNIGLSEGTRQLVQVEAVPAQVQQVEAHGDTVAIIVVEIPLDCCTIR